MITFKDFKTNKELVIWSEYIAVPKQGDLVDLDGETVGVMGVIHSPRKITVMVKNI